TIITVADTINPVINNCWSDTTLFLDSNCELDLPNFLDILTVDDCQATTEVYTLNSMVGSDNLSGPWTAGDDYFIQINSTDVAGNNTLCEFNITLVDTIAPIIALDAFPDTLVIDQVEDCNVIIEDLTGLVNIEEFCGVELIEQVPAPGTYAVGEYEAFDQILFTVYDGSGNSSSDSLAIEFQDNMAPTAVSTTAPGVGIGQDFGGGIQCEFPIDDNFAFGVELGQVLQQQDNCSAVQDIQVIMISPEQNVTGESTADFQVIDEAGNVTDVILTIVVIDYSLPYWLEPENIPSSVELFTEDDISECGVTYEVPLPPALDECEEQELTVSYTSTPEVTDDFFPVGEYLITLTAEDEYANSIDTTYTLTVIDNSAPIIQNCPTEPLSFCSAFIDIPEIMAIDCNDTIILSQSLEDPYNFPEDGQFDVGQFDLMYEATDLTENTSQCIVEIIVTDDLVADLQLTDTLLCKDEERLEFEDILGTSSTGGTFWLFDETSPIPSESTELDPSTADAGVYMIKYQIDASDICFVADSLTVEIFELPELNMPVLEPQCGLELELEIPQDDAIIYTWSDSIGELPTAGSTATLIADSTLANTLYLQGRYSNPMIGCSAMDSIQVELYEQPIITAGEDLLLDFTTSSELSAELIGDGEILWESENSSISIEDDEELNTEVYDLILGENIFTITVTNGVCEVVSDELLITVTGFIIPSAYTPNGDGVNDMFEIQGLNSFSERELVVFNRWGKTIYENKDYENNWDARNNAGDELPDDTYFYVLTLDEETHSGYVIIKR
ncbi:MAG: gliding motility-associated C-terminal domain-containing protein, partial [Flavobacteriales bacterium]